MIESEIHNLKLQIEKLQEKLEALQTASKDIAYLYEGLRAYRNSTKAWARNGIYGVIEHGKGSTVEINGESVTIVELVQDIDYDSYGTVDRADCYAVLEFRGQLYKLDAGASSYGVEWDELELADIKPVAKKEKTVVVYSYE